MAEPKRHMDVPKERVLEGSTHTPAGTQVEMRPGYQAKA